ncbi:hypothetical protein I546_6068 [Mycobacterium kansasii 732]|nr:hypothetical protein I546_6068 [Mycobacterium kansasii 732]
MVAWLVCVLGRCRTRRERFGRNIIERTLNEEVKPPIL